MAKSPSPKRRGACDKAASTRTPLEYVRAAVRILDLLRYGLLAAAVVWSLLEKSGAGRKFQGPNRRAADSRAVVETPLAFRALLCTAVLDSAVRMGFLTFLPFIIKSHGGTLAQTRVGLTLVFTGGAIGKFCCGWMADSLGANRTIMLTEVAIAALILLVLTTPLVFAMVALPFLGIVLNGTSSVLYGAVTDVVDSSGLERAFSVFYTGTIGAGALAPVLYGYVGDHASVAAAVSVIAVTAAVSCLPITVAAIGRPDLFKESR